MSVQLPFVEVRGPEDQKLTIELTSDRITIGRFREFNDVGLEPDPQQLITRRAHCAIERDAEGWWIVDRGSVNKTFVRHGQDMEIVKGRASLTDGDVIRILARAII